MVRDLDNFLGGAETLLELETLLEKFLLRCKVGGVYLNQTSSKSPWRTNHWCSPEYKLAAQATRWTPPA